MEAMILAAGLGTRLGDLTRDTPKALMPVAGVPILDRVVSRLQAAGVDRLIINTHHHSEKIRRHVAARGGYGVEVRISEEPQQPLDTGGALLHARTLFRAAEPFFLHNADILTDLPLDAMWMQHQERQPLATLAVMTRESSRGLLFDDHGLLGRLDEDKGVHIQVRAEVGRVRRLAFGGIHVISPQLLDLLEERGTFSILEPYLRLAGYGFRILPFAADPYNWIDIGKPEQLRQASAWLERSLPSS
jgi:NDP-sugar pyrophosphorylase family protein